MSVESGEPEEFLRLFQRLVANVARKTGSPEDTVRLVLVKMLADDPLSEEEHVVARQFGSDDLLRAARDADNVRAAAFLETWEKAEARGLQPLTQRLIRDAVDAAATGVLEIDWVMQTLAEESDKERQAHVFYALAYLLFDELWPWPHDAAEEDSN